MGNTIDIIFILIFFVATILLFRKWLKEGSHLVLFIAINSLNAGFNILKEYIPTEIYPMYNRIRIILGLTIFLLLYIIGERNIKLRKVKEAQQQI